MACRLSPATRRKFVYMLQIRRTFYRQVTRRLETCMDAATAWRRGFALEASIMRHPALRRSARHAKRDGRPPARRMVSRFLLSRPPHQRPIHWPHPPLRRPTTIRPRRIASRRTRHQTGSTTRAACARKAWSTSAISARSRTPEAPAQEMIARETFRLFVVGNGRKFFAAFRAAGFCSSVTFAYIFISSLSQKRHATCMHLFGTCPYATKQLN